MIILIQIQNNFCHVQRDLLLNMTQIPKQIEKAKKKEREVRAYLGLDGWHRTISIRSSQNFGRPRQNHVRSPMYVGTYLGGAFIIHYKPVRSKLALL